MKEDTERVPLTERVPEHEQKFPNKNTANKCPVCEQNNDSEKQCLEHLKEKHTECKSNRSEIDLPFLTAVKQIFFNQ